ncbi:hypothetical protein FBU59_003966, partial [Linderina macrospora]
MAARLRKGTDLSGNRPRSVEPSSQDNDSSTGSALPATASWASRPPAKKPEPEAKARKPEGGGTMTLRMVPSSRSKASAASATAAASKTTSSAAPAGSPGTAPAAVPVAVATPTAASSSNNNPGTTSNQNSSAQERGKSTASSSDSQVHHPVLQQLSRERKEQLRQQQRQPQSQQQTTEGSAEAGTAKAPSQGKQKSKQTDEQVPVESKKSKTKSKEAPATDTSESKQKSAATPAPAVKQAAAKAAAKTEAKASAEAKAQDTEQTTAGVMTVASADDNDDAKQGGSTADSKTPEMVPDTAAETDAIAGSDTGVGHVTSAQSFQSIADSLFAQLNAKVSTPTTSSVPAFSATTSFNPHLGVGAFPISGVDPLLFPPSSAGGASGSSSLFGAGSAVGAGATSSVFDPFTAQSPSATQWGAVNSSAVNSAYLQSPLSALIGNDNPIAAPLSTSSTAPFGGRQRSRWDFASNGNVDEASAQAELQSVLNRGLPVSPSGPGFTSSRDLGLFSTPAPPGNFSWGSGPLANTVLGNPHGQQQQQQQQPGGAPALPPGLSAAGQRSDSVLRGMAANTPPGIVPPTGGGAPP